MFITPIPPTSSEIPGDAAEQDRERVADFGSGANQVILALDDEVRFRRFVKEEQELGNLLLDLLAVSPCFGLDVDLGGSQVAAGRVQKAKTPG